MAKQQNGHGVIKAGLGLAAVAAAAAGAYYFYGKDGAKNRKQLKSWVVKAKGELMEEIESLKDVSETTYDKSVDKVLAKYKKLKTVAPKEWAQVQKDFKSSWKSVKSEIAKAAKA